MTGIGQSIRKGVDMVHGTGEAIRGKVLETADDIGGDQASAAKNKNIADKGVAQWDRGYRDGANPVDANTIQSTSTNYGPHSTNVGNKLDPRFDSDLDHRGTVTGSTNNGPHETNMGNKLDPRIDSDMDHRANPASSVNPGVGGDFVGISQISAAQTDGIGEDEENPKFRGTHEYRGLINDAPDLQPAHKFDPIYEVGGPSMKDASRHNTHIHRGSISGGSALEAAEKLDPPEAVDESEASHYPEDPSIDKLPIDEHDFACNRESSDRTQPGRDSIVAKWRQHKGEQTYGKDEASEMKERIDRENKVCSNVRRHSSGFLNFLDPRVDAKALKKGDSGTRS